MPRKDKKKKIKKVVKPKTKKILAQVPQKGCLECGYKSGSAFTIPHGYADRFGTQKLSNVQIPPVININLPSNYYKPEPVSQKPMPFEDFGISAEAYNEPFRRTPISNTFIPVEEAFPSTEPVSKNIPILRLKGPGPAIPKNRPLIGGVGGNAPLRAPTASGIAGEELPTIPLSSATTQETLTPRIRRTNAEIYAELLTQDPFSNISYTQAIALANSIPKSELRQRINDLRTEIAKTKKL